MAPPRRPIDEPLLERLASIGCTMADMAYALGVGERLLERRCIPVIERGRAKGRRSLQAKQFELAMQGNTSMLIWLGKNLLGQRDELGLRHGGTIHHAYTPADEGQILAAADEIRFRRLIGEPESTQSAGLLPGDVSELPDE